MKRRDPLLPLSREDVWYRLKMRVKAKVDCSLILYIHISVIYQKNEGKECRMSGIVSSSLGMMSATWRGNVDGNVGGSRTDDEWLRD
jgi:hypothetical protein